MHGQPHMQVLCGTSLPAPQKWEQDHVFLSVDAMKVAEPPAWPGKATPSPADPSGSGSEAHIAEDDNALLLTAQSQMLVYRALAHGVVDDLRIVPLSSARGERHRSSAGSLSCIEEDEETQVVRHRLDDDPPATEQHMRGRRGVADFIAGRIPGTGTHVGMSRRLFAACQNLDVLQVRAAREAEASAVPLPIESHVVWDDEALYAVTRGEQLVYRERQQPRERREAVRDGFEQSDSMSWRMLLGDREPVVDWRRTGLLEGATAETYIAIEASDPVLRSARD